MTTTTIRLDDELKAHVAAAAERAGKTSHGLILDAIAQTVEQSELEQAFHQVADKRRQRILATRQTVAWDDAKTWLEARSRGAHPPRPIARKPGC